MEPTFKNIDISELEDIVINAISPAHIALDILSQGKEIDLKYIERAKKRIGEASDYIRSLRHA